MNDEELYGEIYHLTEDKRILKLLKKDSRLGQEIKGFDISLADQFWHLHRKEITEEIIEFIRKNFKEK